MEKQVTTADPVAEEVIKKTRAAGIETAFDRHVEQGKRCPFGEMGVCCKVCDMGPCRISLRETGAKRGVCGATAETIAARQLIRQVAAGVAAHSDHGHDVVKTLKLAAQGKAQGYAIKDPQRLLALATEWGLKTAGRKIEDIAIEMADVALNEFNQQEGEIRYPSLRAPAATLKIWRELGLIPVGVEHEIVETLHRTHEGVDADYINLIMHGLRTSMGDGWAGAMLATDFGDILFGSPKPVRSQVNLGVLKTDEVNIVVHGHEPTLSEMVVTASRDKDLLEHAQSKGAKGILVGGICCT
ncbi:MAG: carbon monoxide dehydrogenase, partial [Acidobacteriota bacterium]